MSTLWRRSAIAALTVALLAASWVVPAGAAVAHKPTFATPYPWSKVTGGTTGDYLADNYNGINAGHVLENVTTDRLLDILSSNGTYYIVFSGPEHESGQKALGLVNAEAKAAGVTKIYHWDPFLDGHQLNSVDASGIGTLVGGTSVNSSGTANINEPWRLIKALLPSSTFAPGGALAGYDGKGTVLFSVKITDRTDVETGKSVLSSWSLEDADSAAFDPATPGAQAAIQSVFHPAAAGYQLVPSSVRSQYEFFRRIYNASATVVETKVSTPTADRIAAPVHIFSDTDFPNGQGFVLRAVDIKEFYNLANSPGEKVFLFAGNGCHNTQAIIGSVAKEAKRLGTPVVYVVDFSLSSNVHFLTGPNIDLADAATATGGLWIRNSASTPASGTAYPRYGYSYLYAEAAKYFDPGFITENFSKKNNSIAYYPDGDFSSSVTTLTPWATDVLAGQLTNAKRLQVPFLIRYDKDAAQPVIQRWLHKNSANDGTFSEYMLELAWVRQAQPSLDSTSAVVDGLTRTQFASEAVAALEPVLKEKSLAQAAIIVGTQTYTGSAVKPPVTVKFDGKALVSGVDYTVAYSGNVKVGTARVTVTGRGSYIGSKTASFAINPKPTAVTSLSALGAGKLKVAWRKVGGVTKYQLGYRIKGASVWKTKSVSPSVLVSTLAKLRKGKAYQVRVRDYQIASGAAYFSSWSAAKTSAKVK